MIGRPVTCAVFVGRREESAALDAARRGLARSQGTLVLIGGEAGMGKTRLLAQFVRNCGDGRARNLAAGECLERAQQPYGPIRTALAGLAGAVPLEDLAPHVVRALAQLVPDFAPAAQRAAEPFPAIEKAELFGAVLSFLKAVASKRATIVTIEDLHWADASTLDFLLYLAPRLASTRVLVIATYRSGGIDANEILVSALSRLLRESSVRRLMLESFPPLELRALIAGALDGHAPLPDATLRDVERRSEGNPFFAEELLKSALEQRGSHESAALPLSIRASILERMSSLDDDDRRILVVAAVLGYRFDPALLALVMRRDVDTVLPTLRRARDLNIVVEDVQDRIWCRFRHALTRQTVYEDMLAFDRRRLHERILQTLEAFDDPESHLEELAYHAWEAKDAARTLDYNERAGEAAMRLRAIGEAAACFARALDVAVAETDRMRLLERIGGAAQLQGRFGRAIEAFEAALEIRLRRGEFDDAARIAIWIIGDRSNAGDDSGSPFGDSFLATYGDRLTPAARGATLALLARLASARYDFDAVRRYLAQSCDPEQLEPRAQQNFVLARLNVAAHAGDVGAWRALADQLRAIVPELPPFLQVIALYTIGQSGTYLGANDVIERAFADARRITLQWNFTGIDIFGSAVRAAYALVRGRLSEARECIEHALDCAEVVVVRPVLAQIGPLLALALDDDSLAERCSDPGVIAAAYANPADLDDAVLLGARGAWLGARERLPEARRHVRAAIEAMTWAAPPAAALLVAAARYLEPEELPRVTALAEAAAAGYPAGTAAATALLVRATVAARAGRPGEAVDAGQAAARAYAALGWPLFEAQARELAGDLEGARALGAACGAATREERCVAGGAAPLSRREREVAELVTAGLSNTSIAERLSVSKKTVEKHLSSVFVKLGVRSRAQIVAHMLRAASEPEARVRA